MYSLQGYDEVPRRQLGATVFSVALSWICLMYSTSLYTLIRKCSHFLKQQEVHCLCDNWSCDSAGEKKKRSERHIRV